MSSNHGFSLLELVITLSIIAILAGFSYPLYTHHLAAARRKQAQLTLLMIGNQLEEYHSIHNTYRGATLANLPIKTGANMHYQFLISEEGDQYYLLSAVPLNTQKQDPHGTLTLNALGKK